MTDLLDILCAGLSGLVIVLSVLCLPVKGYVDWGCFLIGLAALFVFTRKWSVSPTVKYILAWFGFKEEQDG